MEQYQQRRQQLMDSMGAGSIALIPAAATQPRNSDCDHLYRPSSDFYYLTGFSEPEALAVLCPQREAGEFVLFSRPDDPTLTLWEGSCAGQAGACRDYAADAAFSIDEVDEILADLLMGCDTIYYPLGTTAWLDELLFSYVDHYRKQGRKGLIFPQRIINLDSLLHEQRLIKSATEIDSLRQAAVISAAAHRRAMQSCQPGIFEYQLEAELLHGFQHAGCRFPAYSSIVAGGANACVLHYIDNKAVLVDGDLVLIDAGAECDYYAADITRTFPVNGHFSAAQQALYEIVLAAQLAGLAQAKPGNPWPRVQEAVIAVITQGLIDLGILQGELHELIESKAYQAFYMHNSGHWLGLDVHDVGAYKVQQQWRDLVPGMALTVEPGIYIAADAPQVDDKWRGIGIRIEDDIVINEQGHEVLSDAVPKTVVDIEALMAGARRE